MKSNSFPGLIKNTSAVCFKSILKQIRIIFRSINNSEKLKKPVVSIVSFAAVMSVTVAVLGFSNLTYALSVSVNGNNYGFVRDEKAVDDALGTLYSSLVVAKGDEVSEPSVEYSGALVFADSIISSGELAEKIVEQDDEYLTAATVYVNGELFARSESVNAAQDVIARTVGDGMLYNDVEIRESVMSRKSYEMLGDFSDVCMADVDAAVYYKVGESDTADDIALVFEKLSAPYSTVNDLQSGDIIEINTSLPALIVKSFEDKLTETAVTAEQTGTKAGKITRVMRTYSVAGVEYLTEEISNEFTEKYANKPVATEIVDAGSYGFCWPVDTGYSQYISSYWGDGRSHSGYDIACKKGTPILSAMDGYVESVNQSGSGYGLHFVIKHPNGLKTLYAHCSKLYVTVGDKVARGEVVGLVGSTGNVTGTHLHFEVISGSTRLNPMKYIGKR